MSEEQFDKIVRILKESDVEINSVDAMRKIVSTLKALNLDDEKIIDTLIQIRLKDPYTIFKITNEFPELESYVDVLSKVA